MLAKLNMQIIRHIISYTEPEKVNAIKRRLTQNDASFCDLDHYAGERGLFNKLHHGHLLYRRFFSMKHTTIWSKM